MVAPKGGVHTITVLELSQQAIAQSLADLWLRFTGFLPVLLGALIVFIAGWFIAMTVGKFIQQMLHHAINTLFIGKCVRHIWLGK